MRRLLLGVAAVAVLFVMGCSSAAPVGNGHLGVDWALLPTPSMPLPIAGVCTAATGGGPQTAGLTLGFTPGATVNCGQSHLSETFFVGAFTGADADTDSAPAVGGGRFKLATTTCLDKAAQFLGADPHTSATAVAAVVPSEREWQGDARWFRCEAMQVAGLDKTIVPRTESLAGALTGSGPLATTCANVALNADHTVVLTGTFIACDRPHDVELTGAYTVPDGNYPAAATLARLIGDGCRTVGAHYVGVSAAALLPARGVAVGFALPLSAEQWSAGERTTSCFYGSYTQRRTGSVKGIGGFPY
jgi:hypothetical protein